MKVLANISRILTGMVFMFSGFVKGVDPLGTAYRFEDYFIAYHWEFLMPLALFFSIAMCTLEFSIGAMLFLNFRTKLASWLLLLMMIFFTCLTFYDALYTPVPDCGCFGDAIKLTNWETFYKNIVLIILAIIVFRYRNIFKGWFKPNFQWAAVFTVVLAFAGFCFYCFMHLPVVDFTEWKAGNKLYADNPKPVKYFLTYKNKKSGEKKEYLSPNYPYDDSVWMATWEFDSQRVEDPNQYFGKSLVITDTLQTPVTESIIRNPGYQVIINSYDLKKTNLAAFKRINELSRQLSEQGIPTAVLVSAEPSDIVDFEKANGISMEFYTADDILLKTMVRSNPGMMVLKGGVILDKWHWRDIPDYEGFRKMFP